MVVMGVASKMHQHHAIQVFVDVTVCNAGYEVSGGGFEWFGNNPAHEALTAYGLLQFHDMAKVGVVACSVCVRVVAAVRMHCAVCVR